MKFGFPKGLVFGQKAEISLEEIFELGNLMLLPKKSNLLLAIRESTFLILLKFLRTEILIIFSSITSDHVIFNILRRLLMCNETLVKAQDLQSQRMRFKGIAM